MTAGEVLARGRAAVGQAWGFLRAHPLGVLVALAALAALLVVRGCNVGARAERRADAAGDRELAAAAGVTPVRPVEDLRPQLEAAFREVAGLKEQLERAQRAVPGARPVAVSRARTGAIAASGAPRPAETCPPAPSAAPATCPPCLLAPGDMTEIKVDEVLLETRAGAHLLVGSASTWRTEPLPATPIASGAFEAPFTVAVEKASPDAVAPRWGLGPAVGVSSGAGVLYGATLASPDVRVPLLDWRLSGQATAGIGPGGAAGFVSAVLRP